MSRAPTLALLCTLLGTGCGAAARRTDPPPPPDTARAEACDPGGEARISIVTGALPAGCDGGDYFIDGIASGHYPVRCAPVPVGTHAVSVASAGDCAGMGACELSFAAGRETVHDLRAGCAKEPGPLATTDPGCPAAVPLVGDACAAAALQCSYVDDRHHGLAFECYLGQWRRLFTTAGCEGRATYECPAMPGGLPAGLPAVYTHADHALPPCGACLYPGAVSCGFRAPVRPPYCRGVPPRPTPGDTVVTGWACGPIGPVACATGPKPGERCEPEGVSCGRTCCGPVAVCAGGRWKVARPCPPIP